jgi:hypothetical protein
MCGSPHSSKRGDDGRELESGMEMGMLATALQS